VRTNIPDGRRRAAGFDIGDRFIISRPLDGFHFTMSLGLTTHEIAQIAHLLIGS